MSEKNMVIKHHNGNEWVSLFPKTKASIVETSNGETVEKQIGDLFEGVSQKVDKVEGKGLSTNDFTNALKSKLESLENVEVSSTQPTDSSLWFEIID